MDLLLREPLSVGVIAERLGMRQPQATKHLQMLQNCGLVAMRQDAQRRIYSLRPEPLRELDGWLEKYRALWEQQFERLDRVLEELQVSRSATKQAPRKVRRERK